MGDDTDSASADGALERGRPHPPVAVGLSKRNCITKLLYRVINPCTETDFVYSDRTPGPGAALASVRLACVCHTATTLQHAASGDRTDVPIQNIERSSSAEERQKQEYVSQTRRKARA